MTPILDVNDLHKHFSGGKQGLFSRETRMIRGLDGVSFELEAGEIMAVVGESGCGKSTLALTLMGLEQPTAGSIAFDGQDISHLRARDMKALRRQLQMIFQDPYESLNPMMTIGEIVAEPLRVHHVTQSTPDRNRRIKEALENAGLKPADNFMGRYPHELSGGQRQRVVIAGALVLEPSVLLADEPVSMLDVSIRAEILNLLADLRESLGLSILYITHDLGTVGYIADRIAVMYLGRIVEIGPARQLLHDPQHPYTKALLSVVPVPNPRLRGERVILSGETPDPHDLPPGCRFHPRCPAVIETCREVDPPLMATANLYQKAACVLVDPARMSD